MQFPEELHWNGKGMINSLQTSRLLAKENEGKPLNGEMKDAEDKL
jgi:hypothetical protein